MRQPLDPSRIAALTSESSITRVEVRESVGSTNAELRAATEPWVALAAEHQSAGRGRLGRTWSETPRAGLAVSVRVPVPANAVGWLPLLTGLAMRRALDRVLGYRADLKWPNDLLDPATGRKLAGILCELTPDAVIVGTGLNVDHEAGELPLPSAISVALATGRAVGGIDRTNLLAAYLCDLSMAHADLVAGGPRLRDAQGAYRDACATIGRRIEILRDGRQPLRAVAEAVDDEGRLVISAGGARSAVAAGDVRHVRVGE